MAALFFALVGAFSLLGERGAVMAAGAILSVLLTAWAGGAAFLVWAVLFFRTVRLDARAAFAKYLR